jgi:hypothetical protein
VHHLAGAIADDHEGWRGHRSEASRRLLSQLGQARSIVRRGPHGRRATPDERQCDNERDRASAHAPSTLEEPRPSFARWTRTEPALALEPDVGVPRPPTAQALSDAAVAGDEAQPKRYPHAPRDTRQRPSRHIAAGRRCRPQYPLMDRVSSPPSSLERGSGCRSTSFRMVIDVAARVDA